MDQIIQADPQVQVDITAEVELIQQRYAVCDLKFHLFLLLFFQKKKKKIVEILMVCRVLQGFHGGELSLDLPETCCRRRRVRQSLPPRSLRYTHLSSCSPYGKTKITSSSIQINLLGILIFEMISLLSLCAGNSNPS